MYDTPVLAEKCSCGGATRPVPVTPPGDARPAFAADINLINSIYGKHFGAPLIPEGHLALLNKVPDKDRMEEIVVGGGIAGIIRYFPDTREWEPVPRPEACNLFTPIKRIVVIGDDAVPFIRDQGKCKIGVVDPLSSSFRHKPGMARGGDHGLALHLMI